MPELRRSGCWSRDLLRDTVSESVMRLENGPIRVTVLMPSKIGAVGVNAGGPFSFEEEFTIVTRGNINCVAEECRPTHSCY